MRGGRSSHGAVATAVASVLILGCVESDMDQERSPTPPSAAEPVVAPVPPPQDWARAVRAVGVAREAPVTYAAAALPDDRYATDRLERVRRLVYRVSFIVPPSFRHRRRAIRPVPGELHLDVAADRLRARFVGPGWPIHDGAQIRLRKDVPGVYVFDGDGGRWLGPGQMAAWFEGRPDGRSRSSVRIRREFGKLESDNLSLLVCALLAEWTNQRRAALEPRCRGGSLPPGFRFGPWRAEITAVVPMELPRRALRADEVAPPPPITPGKGATILATAERAQLEPRRNGAKAGLTSLEIANSTPGRLMVLAQGLPVAWVDAGANLTLDGLPAGLYRVGAIRPFGILHRSPKPQPVPGTLLLRGRNAASARRLPAGQLASTGADVAQTAPTPAPAEAEAESGTAAAPPADAP